MSSSNTLIRLIGTPFNKIKLERKPPTDSELLVIYKNAFENRVALLLLSIYRHPNWHENLEEKYQMLLAREKLTFDVVSKVAECFNKEYGNEYVIFKSLKPYPATPNDTDVLFLGSKPRYREANSFLLAEGYRFHEWAPQQKTYYDPRGVGKIGKGKKGGTYYIDFYEEISTDYYAYLNKNNLRDFIITKEINNVPTRLLAMEPELAILMFHNVFPERTFQLEHFYLPLYYFSNIDFKLEVFTKFVTNNKLTPAIITNLSLIANLHKEFFDFIPPPVESLIEMFGINKIEVKRFHKTGKSTPYLFSPRTFWKTFAVKSTDLYSLKSLFVQLLKMFNPKFFIDVVNALRVRFSEKGTYHLE